jgi:MFS family permease
MHSKRGSFSESRLSSLPLYISVFLMRFSFGLVLFTLPIYLPRRTFSNFIVGVISAAYPVTETICGPAVGVLVDRFGRRRWMYIGLAISTIALFAFTLSTNIGFLIVVHAMQGVAAAMIIVSALTMVTDLSATTNLGRKMGIYDFANLGGYMVGILTAGVLTRTSSKLTPFYFAATLAGIGAVFTYLKVKDVRVGRKQSPASPLETLMSLLTQRRSAAMFPIWLAVTTFLGMALTFGPRFGPSPLATSFLFAGAVLVLAVTQPFFGYLSDKYGRDKLMMVGMVSILGLFFTIINVLRGRLLFSSVLPFLVVFGVGSFAFAPAALASLGDVAPERGRGTTMGVYSVVISLGTIIGPVLGGYLLDRYGMTSLFYVCLVILIGALTLAILIAGTNLPVTRRMSLRRRRRASP